MQWLSIESAPKDETAVLCYESGHVYKARWDEASDAWASFCGQPVAYTPEPSHWMPLPEPPQSDA